MTSRYQEASDFLESAERDPKPKPASVPRLTFLIITLLSLLSSIVLLGLSARIVSYQNSDDAKYGQTEVKYPFRSNNGTARNETALINSLPVQSDHDSFLITLAVSAYCIILFGVLAVLIWRPVEKSPFLHMSKPVKIMTFSLVGLATIAQIVASVHALIEDGKSGSVTAANLHKYRNGTYDEYFGPVSWSCDLSNFVQKSGRKELNQLCEEGQVALAFTIFCAFFTASALVIMIYFIRALRRRSRAPRPFSQDLGEEQRSMIRDFLGQ